MAAKLCVFACHTLRREVCAAIKAEGWSDVVAIGFPDDCGHPPLRWDVLKAGIPDDCTQVIVLGGACLKGLGEPPVDSPPVRLLSQTQCFHTIADPILVAEALNEGSYLMTPGWLAGWRGRLANMGFAPEAAGGFFRDFAHRLVLLDTGVDPEIHRHLEEMSDTVGLPARALDVGLDHLRSLLGRAVLEWRLELERHDRKERDRSQAREVADQLLAMDQMAHLAKAHLEMDAIAIIEELFRMLFAPGAFHYLRVEHGRPTGDQELPAELLTALLQLDAPCAWAPSGKGFLLRIAHDDETMGLLAVDHLAFPEHRERYLNLALVMSGVCALAIENARTHKRLIEIEKMASLGVVVAGVAHEINTPTGVGLIASSALHEQSQWLARRFREHSMTQSDLQTYLDTSMAETRLIRVNLERIGQLIEAFRQVAVEGTSPTRSRFLMKRCIDEVIASLGRLLAPERFSLTIQCDEHLELESFPQDWASILTNLITNSLRHGFRNRDHGAITLSVAAGERQLSLDYRDDGIGLSPEARQRIFDPFFTTDLQQGMGLGMHLVFNLVTHRLGGSISCESRPGEGSHFHIEVPQ